MSQKEPPEFDRTSALVLLTAAAKSNNEGAIRLAMQLANANPCEACGYVHFHCQCDKKEDTAATPKDVGDNIGVCPHFDFEKNFDTTFTKQEQEAWEVKIAANAAAYEREIDKLHGLLAEVNPVFISLVEIVRDVAEQLSAKAPIDMPKARATIDALLELRTRIEDVLSEKKHD